MKLTLTKLLETSRYIATAAGQDLAGALEYIADLAEQTITALRQGLGFADNFDCDEKSVTLKHETAQTITTRKPIRKILVTRVVSQSYALAGFGWYYDDRSQPTLWVSYAAIGSAAAPTSATALAVELVILYL